ncbi:hypothetical protein Q1B75_002206 [Salmonella enterica]
MKTLYLDHNVIIDIQQKRKPTVAKKIENIDKSKFQILFSPAHIEEIAALKMHHGQDDGKVNTFLELLTRITNSNALLPYKRKNIVLIKNIGIYIYKESPINTYNRVISAYGNNHLAEEHQKEKIARGEFLEETTGVTSREANSINIQNEIDIFKPNLHQIILENYQASLPFLNEYLPPHIPAYHEIKFNYLSQYFPLHEMTIEKIFEFLEARRFYPDKSTQFLSGLHDTTHAIYAAYCDVFVTNDKKLKNKTAETYKWLGINTLILTPDELVDYLE